MESNPNGAVTRNLPAAGLAADVPDFADPLDAEAYWYAKSHRTYPYPANDCGPEANLAREAFQRWRELADDPPPRPVLTVPGCPPAEGCVHADRWHPDAAAMRQGGIRDWLCYEAWSAKGWYPADPSCTWPAWRRFVIPIQSGWWPLYRDALRREIYEAGRRLLGGAHWDADRRSSGIDNVIKSWAVRGDCTGREEIAWIVEACQPVPAEPGPLAIESDPWAGHLEWAGRWSGGASFTIAAMLNAAERDPDAVPVPGVSAPGSAGAAIRAGKAYGRQAGREHAGFELQRLPGAHGTLGWQVAETADVVAEVVEP